MQEFSLGTVCLWENSRIFWLSHVKPPWAGPELGCCFHSSGFQQDTEDRSGSTAGRMWIATQGCEKAARDTRGGKAAPLERNCFVQKGNASVGNLCFTEPGTCQNRLSCYLPFRFSAQRTCFTLVFGDMLWKWSTLNIFLKDSSIHHLTLELS